MILRYRQYQDRNRQMKPLTLILSLLVSCAFADAQEMSFDLTKQQPVYSDAVGYGYDVVEAPTAKSVTPFYFSVKVPDGNYRVTVRLGNKKRDGETTVRAESRRMMVEKCVTKKGKFQEFSFIINKRNVDIPSFKGIDGKDFYFVHSYYVTKNEEDTIAYTEYANVKYTCAVQKGNLFATQFHPEKSGEVGLKILKNFGEL